MVVLSYALKFEYHKKIKSESIRGGMFLDSSVFPKRVPHFNSGYYLQLYLCV